MAASPSASAGSEDIESLLVERLAKVLELEPEKIDRHRSFAELGLDSILVVQLTRALEAKLGRPLSYTVIHDYPNIAALSKHLTSLIEQGKNGG
jgi:polyketide synthase PksN